jgi:hypothetical protein
MMKPEAITDQLQRTLQFAREFSDPTGRMHDPYETEYGENYAPACFSIVAATLYRLHGRPEDRAWALRWGQRSAAIMRGSPGLREYMLGYTAMIFGLLEPDAEIEALRQDYVSASLPAEPLSPFAHILALQLIGDLLCPRSPASLARAATIVKKLEELWTPAGFPEDQSEGNDGSIPHAYLTVANLAVFLIARPQSEQAQKLQPRIEALITRSCDWFERVNGTAMVAAQANRSYNQLWVFPLYALLAYVQRGEQAMPVVEKCLSTVTRATGNRRRSNFLPTALSPYASGGNEPYNRVNNDVGAGGVGWALLAVLAAAGAKGLAQPLAPVLAPVFVDAAAGYACFHGSAAGVLLPTKHFRWRYHYPLQPAWVVVGGAEAPFVGAKRSGVNNPYANLLAEPSKVSPLLEPYFGVMALETNGTHHVMQEPVETRAAHVFSAALRPDGAPLTAASGRVSVQVQADAGAVSLTYRIEGETPGGLWLSIPVLLWDGTAELHYRIAGARVELDWQSRAYVLTATAPDGDGQKKAPSGAWLLRRERFLHTGFGVTGNFAFALGSVRAVRVQLAPR